MADIVLIAGLWLEASVWDDVAETLERLGQRPVPVALPGADDASTSATLDDQVAAVLGAVDESERPVVVGHSAACSLAWMAADQRPEAIRRVVLVGGFPWSDGQIYADLFERREGIMPFPGWDPFEGPDSADLDEAARRRFSAAAVPVPEGVATGVVRLADERRFDLPVTVVCPEFSADDARGWIEGGDVPELAQTTDLTLVDIESGHWPMISCPDDFARLLDDVIGRSDQT